MDNNENNPEKSFYNESEIGKKISMPIDEDDEEISGDMTQE